MVVNADPTLWAAGVAIILAIPLTFMVANWVRKNVDHGEARFDTRERPESDEETK
ncbi:MAG: glutamyl-tRNA amidotransferase [Erythrobacter sp.]|nr:glutamyl-tRNA amidotransferase [Erythrobacter sp.]